jgi:hypothetical protein
LSRFFERFSYNVPGDWEFLNIEGGRLEFDLVGLTGLNAFHIDVKKIMKRKFHGIFLLLRYTSATGTNQKQYYLMKYSADDNFEIQATTLDYCKQFNADGSHKDNYLINIKCNRNMNIVFWRELDYEDDEFIYAELSLAL